MKEIIEKIKSKIMLESSSHMTKEQEYYVSGLADALQIIEDSLDKELKIGNTYFVIMQDNNGFPYVEEIRLYRINKKKRWSYCFTRYLTGDYPCPDLVLSSKGGLMMRVFKSKEEAESRKSLVQWR